MVQITTCIEFDGKKYDVICKDFEHHAEWLGSFQRYVEKQEKEKDLIIPEEEENTCPQNDHEIQDSIALSRTFDDWTEKWFDNILEGFKHYEKRDPKNYEEMFRWMENLWNERHLLTQK